MEPAPLQPGPVMDAFREQIRAVLRVRGFSFCDEGDGSPESNARAVADMRSAASSVEGREEVIAAGVEASTVDHQDQSIREFSNSCPLRHCAGAPRKRLAYRPLDLLYPPPPLPTLPSDLAPAPVSQAE